jgi:xanthine dehydrogenase accessory factor
MLNDYFDKAAALHQQGQPFVLATVVRAERPTSAKPGMKAIITADGTLTGWVGGSCAQPTVIREALQSLRDGQPRLLRLCPPDRLGQKSQDGVVEVALTCVSGGTLEVYIEPQLPKPHLVAVGHLPVTEALVTLGKALGYRVTVIRLEGATDSLPQADQVLDQIDFSQIEVTPQTYIVVASHGNYDEEALEAALKTEAGYVALVSSRQRAEAVLEYLRDAGVPDESLSRLKYPAGLDFGAVTPEEIALSILAEIVQHRRRPPDEAEHRQTPTQTESENATDPVCGMTVEVATARYAVQLNGDVYYFCCAGCQRSFEKEPETYLTRE